LAYAGGLPLAQQLARSGKKVFVDLKLHDIGNTVARGVESVAKLGATFLTVHAYPQTMKAAVEARAGSGLKILAVTVLTSYDAGARHRRRRRLSGGRTADHGSRRPEGGGRCHSGGNQTGVDIAFSSEVDTGSREENASKNRQARNGRSRWRRDTGSRASMFTMM